VRPAHEGRPAAHHPGQRAPWPGRATRGQGDGFFGASRGRPADATVEVTEESDSEATAELTTYGEDPVASLELVKEGDEWKIDGSYMNLTRAYRFQF
jgi:hypothetical protein